MISDLERAAIRACESFREGQIGEELRRFSATTRAGGPGGTESDELARYEINAGAPITRTLRTLQMMRMGGTPVDTTGAEDLLEWLPKAVAAVQRLAQMCWQPIPKRERTLVLDEDDLGPAGSPYLPGTRSDEPGPSLRFGGLAGSEALESWRACAARRARPRPTPRPDKSRRSAARKLHRELVECREACMERLRGVLQGPPVTSGEGLEAQAQLIRDAYADSSPELREAAGSIRRYNELLNHLLWAVLSVAEASRGLETLQGDLGAVRVTAPKSGPQHVSLVLEDDGVWFGNPPTPFVIERGLPIDGLYVLRASMFQFERTGLIDIHGTRIASLELAANQGSTPACGVG